MDILTLVSEQYKEIDEVREWINFKYDELFHGAFDKLKDAYKHMKSEIRPISDAELEWALTELPMEMFDVSEILNQLRLDYEVIKLENKRKRRELSKNLEKSAISATSKSEEVAGLMVEYEIVASAYSALISRVDNEISCAKEFIMGCKKVWDARRKVEQSNPVGPVLPNDYQMSDDESLNTPNLPDYPVNLSN